MGIALLAAATLTHPLTALHRWLSTRRSALGPHRPAHSDALQQPLRPLPLLHVPASTAGLPPRQGLHEPLHHNPIAVRKACKPATRPLRPLPRISDTHPPLRVLRSHTSACGRMVITGRMADVCAELDRLAACENRH